MFAQATIIGNLTKDIKLKYMASGTAIGNTAIASTHKFNAANGEKREETCFIYVGRARRRPHARPARQLPRLGHRIRRPKGLR